MKLILFIIKPHLNLRLSMEGMCQLQLCIFCPLSLDAFLHPVVILGYFLQVNHEISLKLLVYFIYLFGVLCRFQQCTGHITTGSWKGRGNQYIQFVRVLYCKLPTNGKQLPEAVPGIEPWPQRWEARVLPLCHRGPL